ncbi:hypothetical protein Pmani_037486, partial [Petrolisthes manimaculis]
QGQVRLVGGIREENLKQTSSKPQADHYTDSTTSPLRKQHHHNNKRSSKQMVTGSKF